MKTLKKYKDVILEANMSYCRFENTYHDLLDCFRNMDDEYLSKTENKFKTKLVQLCKEFSDSYYEDYKEP